MIGQISGKRRADRGSDADRRPHDALRQVEAAGAARDVGDHQGHHHAERCRGYPIEQLCGDQQIGIGDQGKQQRSDHQCRKCQQQERTSPPQLSVVPDPGRYDSDNELWHNDAGRNQHGRPLARPLGHDAAHERQHRGIREMEQQRATSKDHERALAQNGPKVGRRTAGLLLDRTTVGPVRVDFGRTNAAEGHQGRNEQGRCNNENPTRRIEVSDGAHGGGRRPVANGGKSGVAAEPLAHCRMARPGRGSRRRCMGRARSLRPHVRRRQSGRPERSETTHKATQPQRCR